METIHGLIELATIIEQNGNLELYKKLHQIIEDLEDKPREAIRTILKANKIAQIIAQESA